MANIIIISGPQAVGKMTVAEKLKEKIGYSLMINHATMAVDTHVYRVSHRMGLVPKTADTPRKVEDYLMKHIPAEDIPNAHHWILLHGRYICKSTKPLCDKCFFNEYCPKLLKDSKL